MSNNQNTTIQLNDNDLTTLIKSLSASNHYHKNYNDLDKNLFIDDDELKDIIENNDRIKQILKDSLQVLDTSCPRSSETANPRQVAVNGGIPNYIEALKHINALVKGANEFAYDNSIINDDDHYELLEIELKIQQLITRDSIIEDAVRSVCFDDIPPCFYSHPVNGSAMPFNLE